MKQMTPQRLYRYAAICDWAIAALVCIPCAAMLHSIRTGQFHNSNWVDPSSWARTMEWGLGLSLACATAGSWLWIAGNSARWFDSVLSIPKLYCAAIALFLFALTSSLLFMSIVVTTIISLGLSVLFWLPDGLATLARMTLRESLFIESIKCSASVLFGSCGRRPHFLK
jgi:hypothetical protein